MPPTIPTTRSSSGARCFHADRVLKTFQTGFVGKASPVHLSGEASIWRRRVSRADPRRVTPGGIPNCPDWVMEEAESHQNVTVGWWPLSEVPGPAFYAYAYPEPKGIRAAAVRCRRDAFFDIGSGEFLLPYDAVRIAADPDAGGP